MAYMGQFKNTQGHYYYQKKEKRDRLNGEMAAVPAQITLAGIYYTGGPFIAETIWVANPTAGAATFDILDGAVSLLGGAITIAANTMVNISPIYMPFFTNVNFVATVAGVTCTMGGWIP